MTFLEKCSYCGKIYKSEHFFKLHIKKHKEAKVIKTTFTEIKTEEPKIITIKPKRIKIQYRQIVYVGTADKATITGKITGKKYSFVKDRYSMPISVKVDERDYPGVIALKGKGCVRRDPNALFVSKQDWDLEIAGARSANR